MIDRPRAWSDLASAQDLGLDVEDVEHLARNLVAYTRAAANASPKDDHLRIERDRGKPAVSMRASTAGRDRARSLDSEQRNRRRGSRIRSPRRLDGQRVAARHTQHVARCRRPLRVHRTTPGAAARRRGSAAPRTQWPRAEEPDLGAELRCLRGDEQGGTRSRRIARTPLLGIPSGHRLGIGDHEEEKDDTSGDRSTTDQNRNPQTGSRAQAAVMQ